MFQLIRKKKEIRYRVQPKEFGNRIPGAAAYPSNAGDRIIAIDKLRLPCIGWCRHASTPSDARACAASPAGSHSRTFLRIAVPAESVTVDWWQSWNTIPDSHIDRDPPFDHFNKTGSFELISCIHPLVYIHISIRVFFLYNVVRKMRLKNGSLSRRPMGAVSEL